MIADPSRAELRGERTLEQFAVYLSCGHDWMVPSLLEALQQTERAGQRALLARLREHEKRLQEIREREQRATAGPWVVEEHESDHGGYYITGHITATAHTYAGNKISRTDSVNDPNSLTRRDAEFIAHARLDIAFLLDLLDQAQREAGQ